MIHNLITINNMNPQHQHLLMDEILSTNFLSNSSHEPNSSNSSLNASVGDADFPPPPPPRPPKRKRSLPGHPDPDAEVIALSPNSLLATNRFVCEICKKGFQRDQNLQLHRRGHNLPWKLKQRSKDEVVRKKAYVCPERGCVHHDPARALGDLTGIKKHFYRKHGEKKWKCGKCSKKYAVQSDWKAHSKTCGTKEYKCDCGTLFSRRDSFITHRAFCEALVEENARTITSNPFLPVPEQEEEERTTMPPHQSAVATSSSASHLQNMMMHEQPETQIPGSFIPPWLQQQQTTLPCSSSSPALLFCHDDEHLINIHPPHHQNPSHVISSGPMSYHHPPAQPHMSATALLQKAAQLGAIISTKTTSTPLPPPITPHHNPPPIFNFSSSRDQHITTTNNNNNTFLGFFTHALTADSSAGPANVDIGRGSGGGSSSSSSSSHLLHDILMMKSMPNSFDGDMNAIVNGGMISDGLTRDFLGLSPLIPSNDFANHSMPSFGDANAAVSASQDDDDKAW